MKTKPDEYVEKKVEELTPQKLASIFHDTYETLAPAYGYGTRKQTRDFDSESSNGKLMIATCKFILETEIEPALTDTLAEGERRERERMREEISQALWNEDGSLKSHDLTHVVSTAIHKTLNPN